MRLAQSSAGLGVFDSPPCDWSTLTELNQLASWVLFLKLAQLKGVEMVAWMVLHLPEVHHPLIHPQLSVNISVNNKRSVGWCGEKGRGNY